MGDSVDNENIFQMKDSETEELRIIASTYLQENLLLKEKLVYLSKQIQKIVGDNHNVLSKEEKELLELIGNDVLNGQDEIEKVYPILFTVQNIGEN